tara:strand:+ start:28 stop:414 length:387 start_codon:yes stop_codon:yes gene_type:complete
MDDDLRAEDAGYRRLGFSPVCQIAGDTHARWRQLLDEIDQSLHLARLAERDRVQTERTGSIETPRGPWSARRPADASALFDELLPGLEWGDALAAVASLDVAGLTDQPVGTRPSGESRAVRGGTGNDV